MFFIRLGSRDMTFESFWTGVGGLATVVIRGFKVSGTSLILTQPSMSDLGPWAGGFV